MGGHPRDEPPFAIPGRCNRPDPLARVLEWLDRHGGDPALAGEGYRDWEPFEHPSLGRVEIGGFTRYWLRNPPPGPYFREIAVDQARFAVLRGLKLPRARIRAVETEAVGGERWRIRIRAGNEGWLDTSMEQARLAGISEPDRLRRAPGAGASQAVRVLGPPLVEFPFMRGTRGGAYESWYYGEWEVTGPEGTPLALELRSLKGGVHRMEVRLGEP